MASGSEKWAALNAAKAAAKLTSTKTPAAKRTPERNIPAGGAPIFNGELM